MCDNDVDDDAPLSSSKTVIVNDDNTYDNNGVDDDTPLFSATTDVGNYNDVYDADGVDDVKVK